MSEMYASEVNELNETKKWNKWDLDKEKEFIQSTLDVLNTQINEGEITPSEVRLTKLRFPGGPLEFLTKYWNAVNSRRVSFDGNGDLKDSSLDHTKVTNDDWGMIRDFIFLKVAEING